MSPINSLDDLTLINKIKADDESDACIEELQKRHGGIVSHVYQNYMGVINNSGVNSISTGHKYGDVKRTIWEAAKNFDESKKSKYSTWLYNSTRFICLNAIRESNKEISCDPDTLMFQIDNESHEEPGFLDINEEDILAKAKEFIENIKEPHIKQLMTLRYLHSKPNGKKYTWKEISDIISYTPQHIYNMHNSCLEKLRTHILSSIA